MPTKKPRIMVNFSDEALYDLLMKDCELQDRSDSAMIMRILKLHYANRKDEASLFRPDQLSEGKRVPVFEDTPPPQTGRASKIHASLDRAGS